MPSNIIVCHLTHTIIYSRKTGFCSSFVTEFSIPFCFLTTMKMSYRKYTIIVLMASCFLFFCRKGLAHFNIFFLITFFRAIAILLMFYLPLGATLMSLIHQWCPFCFLFMGHPRKRPNFADQQVRHLV